VYLFAITATNTANVAFFAQQDTSLKGSAMAFQFLVASLMSCRLVLSLRDTEATSMNSAAASVATLSFWKTGHGGNEPDASQRSRAVHILGDEEAGNTADVIHMNKRNRGHTTNGTVPAYAEPLPVQ
jgi:hypothetical protein